MEKENKNKKARPKWYVKLLLIILIIFLYGYFIGTKGIFTKEYQIKTSKVEQGFDGLKILQFSDLHYGSSVNKNELTELIKSINETKPDVVIFTGDLINKNYKLSTDEKEFIISKLSKINSELGMYFINGEEDNKQSISILTTAGFISLEDGAQLIYNNTKSPILLISKNNVDNYFKSNESTPNFKILAMHNPDDYDKYQNYNFDMVIAGHTHNGQINIPKVKDLFINTKYDKPYQKINNTKLFINSGIGCSKINIRLFNHPIINLYRIYKTSTKK